MKQIPMLGVGTARLEGKQVVQSVRIAFELGFRHIDTAQIYGNEADVGKAVAGSGLERREIFLTTKVWLENLGRARFLPSVRESLQKLRTEYVDLLLIHWPAGEDGTPMVEYLEQLSAAKQAGLARAIGVSNFTNAQLDQAVAQLGAGQIATNQVEVHPYLQNDVVVDHCQSLGIPVTGYMPLAKGKVVEDKVLGQIAQKHRASIAEVVIAWSLARGIITIPSSTKRAHLQSNLAAASLRLTSDDVQQIKALERGEHLINPSYAPAWDL
ncbi:2,5-didehydrogluconate reductase DkgB [Microbulbifer epialgicus]|uniref:2,5-didehydrogluconate reductase DkgB n=1 Tax=Microbulbifer epialgicus TaxID=393907 RepID=A0ABV4NTZ6_9GAMM